MFDAAVWGTVGQWVSGLASSGALLLGFSIMIRDRIKTEREQAAKISIRIQDVTLSLASKGGDEAAELLGDKSFSEFAGSLHPHVYAVYLSNPTETAVTNVRIHTVPYSYRQYRRVAKWVAARPDCPNVGKNEWAGRSPRSRLDSTIGTERDVLDSKQSTTRQVKIELPRYLITPLVAFTDLHGERWIRYPITGKLVRHSYRRENTPKPLRYDSKFYGH